MATFYLVTTVFNVTYLSAGHLSSCINVLVIVTESNTGFTHYYGTVSGYSWFQFFKR